MATEYETQVLDIDCETIVDKLRKVGAEEFDEVLQKRWVFDIDPYTKESTGEWIRLRQVGESESTLTYKKKSGKGLAETEELEIKVENFDETAKILSKISFAGKYYQENRRKKFVFDEIEFTLDTWPMIPTFLEVEAASEKKVREGLRLLGLADKDVGHIGVVAIYNKYGINLHSLPSLTF